MSNIGRIKDLAKRLFLTNISNGVIDLTIYNEEELLFLELILEKELSIRREKKIICLKSKSGIDEQNKEKTLDNFNCNLTTNITKWHIEKLKDETLLKNKTNIILIGSAGVGKTHLACGMVIYHVMNEKKCSYLTVTKLLDLINNIDLSLKTKRKIDYIKSSDLVVIDEVGYIPVSREEAIKLYNLINEINNYASICIITNREFNSWGDIFIDKVMASTIIDRLIENSIILKIDAKSYRVLKHEEKK